MSDITWTADEMKTFDRLTNMNSSIRQMDRIEARLALRAFVKEHGQEKCDAMFAHLMQQERRQP